MSASKPRDVLGVRLSETLQAYFEMKAASSLYRTYISESKIHTQSVSFKGLSSLNLKIFSGNRTVIDLIDRVSIFCNYGELAYSNFLTQVSHLEGFIVAILNSKGDNCSGTFGQLQTRMLSYCSDKNSDDVTLLNEIRERRNCLIHHGGIASQKYINTLSIPALPIRISSTSVGDQLSIDGEYLSYATERFWAYSAHFA